MLNHNEIELIDFVQQAVLEQPVWRRIKIYRGLADMVQHPGARKIFLNQSLILEDAEARCAELPLNIDESRKIKPSHDGHGKDGHK